MICTPIYTSKEDQLPSMSVGSKLTSTRRRFECVYRQTSFTAGACLNRLLGADVLRIPSSSHACSGFSLPMTVVDVGINLTPPGIVVDANALQGLYAGVLLQYAPWRRDSPT